MTLSVSAAARLAGVPRSWLRRAIERRDFRCDDDGRVSAALVPKIRKAHRSAMVRRVAWRDLPETSGQRIESIDHLADSIDQLGYASNAVTPDELAQLIEDAASLAAATNHPTWAKAMYRAARVLKPRARRAKETP